MHIIIINVHREGARKVVFGLGYPSEEREERGLLQAISTIQRSSVEADLRSMRGLKRCCWGEANTQDEFGVGGDGGAGGSRDAIGYDGETLEKY